jgi:hypothetical protein
MKARQLIEGASFGPEALKVMGAAFDAVWAEIENNFSRDPTVVEAARLLVAEAVLLVANEESRDVETRKREVLRVLEINVSPKTSANVRYRRTCYSHVLPPQALNRKCRQPRQRPAPSGTLHIDAAAVAARAASRALAQHVARRV